MEFRNTDRVEKRGDEYFLVGEDPDNMGEIIAGPFPNQAAAEREFNRRQGNAQDQERRKKEMNEDQEEEKKPRRGERQDQNRRKK